MRNISVLLVCCVCSFNLGIMTESLIRYDEIHAPKVELPEEYKAIDSTDCLKGYFDKDSVLQIRFNKTGKLKTE